MEFLLSSCVPGGRERGRREGGRGKEREGERKEREGERKKKERKENNTLHCDVERLTS